jgi:hypothetical protein
VITPWTDLPLRTVTPAFLGRFDQVEAKPAEVPFPVPSLRGVLAYWLRALAGAHVGASTSLLHDVESALFGAARAGSAGGPSPIQLRARRVRLSEYPVARAEDGLRYLMGPGLTAAKEPPPRCLAPGPLELRVRNVGKPAHADLFLAALWALRTFGGIGARTRRGFGTFAIDHAPSMDIRRFDPGWLTRDAAGDLNAVLGCVAAAIGDLGFAGASRGAGPTGVPPRYPCFAPGYYRYSPDEEAELSRARSWSAALGAAGDRLWRFRHDEDMTNPGPPPRGTHSQTYTDVVQPFLNRRPQQGPLTAAALGLPIPYSDHQGPCREGEARPGQRRAMVDVLIDDKPARRASPLWLRIRHDGSAWRLRSLVFHSEWLPAAPGVQLRITAERRSAVISRPTHSQVRAELDRWFDQSPGTPKHDH